MKNGVSSKWLCYGLASVVALFTLLFLLLNVVYVDGYVNGIKGASAIFGGRVVLESTIGLKTVLDLEASVGGIIMLIINLIVIGLLIYSAGKQSKIIMNVSGTLLIVSAFMNMIFVSDVADEIFSVNMLSNAPIVAVSCVVCVIVALANFIYVYPLKNK